jgi:hypothetical protein
VAVASVSLLNLISGSVIVFLISLVMLIASLLPLFTLSGY